ncbi:MAG: sensor histidine kinase [Desulfosalsimonas sp.]
MIRSVTRKQVFTALLPAVIPAVAAFLLFPYLPAAPLGGIWAGLFAAAIGICAFFAGVSADARKENQHQSDARQRYERLFAASDVMVYTVGLFGEYLSANPKLFSAYGYDSEVAMLGLLYADFHDTDESDTFQAHVDRVFAEGSPVQYEAYDRRLGQWLSHTLSPIVDTQQNRVFAVAGVSKDITERVRKQEELKKAYETLRETRDQLIQKDKMAALGRVASGVAHEIRNPLEIISMGVDYLENLLPPGNPRAAESVEKINQAIDRANFIIENVLKFSRKTEITISPTDICEAVTEALFLSRHHFEKSGVTVNRDFPHTPLWVAGNRNMLIQVMLNLINNAVDAMADSEVKQLEIRISAMTADKVGYKIGYRRADYFKMGESMVVVEISDTGRGMDQDVLGKIFEPFFSTRTSGGGTGLGLSLAHMIMDRMMGTIDVASRPEAGSVFYLKLQPAENLYLMEGQAHGQ